MPLILSGNVASATAAVYDVANSCVFTRGDSPKMTKDASSSNNIETATISLWCKRGRLATDVIMFAGNYKSNNNYYCFLKFRSDDKLMFTNYDNGTNCEFQTTRLFRDPTAWLHICVRCDLSQAEANRVKIYVNGTQETSFSTSTNMTGDQFFLGKSGYEINVSNNQSASYFDGHLAEVVYIDGTSYAPTSFGEFNSETPTVWQPIDVSGLTFGTNGFYLDFEASDNLGNDANGGTDLTESNLAATDQSTDSPTNNFATFNPVSQPSSDLTFSEGNTKMTVAHASGSHHIAAFSTIAVTAGKWYVEGKCTETNDTKWTHGIANVEFMYNKTGTTNWIPGRHDHSQDDTIGNYTDDVWKNGTETVSDLFGSTESDGDIVMMAIDCDNGKIWFGRNGTWNNGSATDSTTFNAASHDTTFTTGDDYVVHFVAEDTAWLANFGNPAYANSSSAADENGYGDFEYAPPSGFLAICTKNLGENGG